MNGSWSAAANGATPDRAEGEMVDGGRDGGKEVVLRGARVGFPSGLSTDDESDWDWDCSGGVATLRVVEEERFEGFEGFE